MYRLTRACRKAPAMLPDRISYRQHYFERARVRTDGVYICKVSYFRPGMTEGAFFQPIHLVTYYRYLRFFSWRDRFAVLLLVTTEEPKRAIEMLRWVPGEQVNSFVPFGRSARNLVPRFGCKRIAPTLKDLPFKRANVFLGKYYREAPESSCLVLALFDPQSTHRALFHMELTVSKEGSVIVCDQYTSLSPPLSAGGEICTYDFGVSDWGKFRFSRVRSIVS